MHAGLFSRLAADSSLSQTHAFSQQAWRQRHYPPGQSTLCAGLTSFWLSDKLQAGAPLACLDAVAPDPLLLRRIARLQALSYYPAFPPGFTPGQQELMLLAGKYGTQDWPAIQRHVASAHQGDFVLYDLARMFAPTSASIVRLATLPASLPALPPLAAGSAVIGVLRYLEHGQPGGHRIACWRDHRNEHHFFDPNAGEIVAPDDASFHRWLAGFLVHGDHHKFQPAPGEDFLTLYLLENVVPPHGDGQHGHTLVESA